MTPTLPPEIWCLILNDLPRSDQLRICQVSPILCTLARRTIYDKVALNSNSPNIHATLALFVRDHFVARNITRLHIRTFSEGTEERNNSSWFNPGALAGMTRLRDLRLREFTFRTKEDEEAFNNVVSKSLTSLRKFDYRDLYTRKSVPQGPSAEEYIPKLQIKGLEEIMCIEQDTFTHPSLILTTLTASCSTLIQIHLPIPTSSPSSAELLKNFLTLHFPHLSTLHLGGWAAIMPVDEVFTTFLLAHPLIEDLQLGFYDAFDDTRCRLSPKVVLGPGALPNLYHLKADAFNVAILARGGVLSLKTIEHLHTSTANGWAVGIFEEMCGALETYGGLPGLKILKLELEEDDDYPYNVRWIDQLGKLCPSVENFWGDMGVGWTARTKICLCPIITSSY
ncbi:hypothetical protein BDZ94DRAFT_188755 [Collybia nuda]|uniref:F-box domain-containing protein n=1 Tax=Collybia nuda TaxID=64659 RepID=A0A9P6CA07_9AGAR|nr:hypothetical protein BDZ94DRAFT_188755 [Collybia nuda]